MRSRWPRTFTRRTQKPVSGLWKAGVRLGREIQDDLPVEGDEFLRARQGGPRRRAERWWLEDLSVAAEIEGSGIGDAIALNCPASHIERCGSSRVPIETVCPQSLLEETLPNDRQAAIPHPDRQQIQRAREAAEALFKPTPGTAGLDAAAAAIEMPIPAEPQAVRPPRILTAVPVQVEHPETQADPRPQPKARTTGKARKVSKSAHGRIRALVTYGMTPQQVADLHELPVSEIERIIKAAKA